jgi:hypothetical protein
VYDLQLNHLSSNGVLRGTFGSIIAWYKARVHVAARCLSYACLRARACPA